MHQLMRIQAINQKKKPSPPAAWLNLRFIIPNKSSHAAKASCQMIPLKQHSGKGKTTGAENRVVVARIWKEEWVEYGVREMFEMTDVLYPYICQNSQSCTFCVQLIRANMNVCK